MPPKNLISIQVSFGFVSEIYQLQELGLCDEVCVYTRGESINQPKLLYKTGDDSYRDFKDAIDSERNRQKSELLRNPGDYLSKIENIKQRQMFYAVHRSLLRLRYLLKILMWAIV